MVKPSDDIAKAKVLYKGNDAETVEQIMKQTGLGSTTVKAYAVKMVNEGKWLRVMIKENNKIKPAYRVK